QDLWGELNLDIASFASLGLSPDASDVALWQACQAQDVVFITANRNKDGSDSLEATIASQNEPRHLPVLTVSDAEQILTDRDYAARVVAQLLEFLFDLDNIRGTGRLYLP
ncbi:MAG: ACP S-malonyltransferase, partial [Planctomycetota bacterium]